MSDNKIFDPNSLNIDFSKPTKKKLDNQNGNTTSNEKKEEEHTKDLLENIEVEESNNENKEGKEKKNNGTLNSDLESSEYEKKDKHQEDIYKIQESQERIIDINIKSIEGLVNLLIDNQYDFLIVEPLEIYVKISCQKDSRIVEEKYIKYHIYSKILVNVKQLTNLEVEEIEKEQQ
jgi:hypothetical protein